MQKCNPFTPFWEWLFINQILIFLVTISRALPRVWAVSRLFQQRCARLCSPLYLSPWSDDPRGSQLLSGPSRVNMQAWYRSQDALSVLQIIPTAGDQPCVSQHWHQELGRSQARAPGEETRVTWPTRVTAEGPVQLRRGGGDQRGVRQPRAVRQVHQHERHQWRGQWEDQEASREVDTSLSLSAVTFRIMHSKYFALVKSWISNWC